jgi:ABC-type glycerol-3-phosphate transport system substrate-binding protein
MLNVLLSLLCLASTASAEGKPEPIEWLLPSFPHSVSGDRALANQVEAFNRQNPATPVRLVRRGEDFSSLRELMARKLAGDLPDIAAIAPSELQAVERLQILKPVPQSLVQALGKSSGASSKSLPFLRAIPLLVVNTQRLPQGATVPKDWAGLSALVDALAQRDATSSEVTEPGFQLALPLQGARGLWLFEALADRPLWTRVTGGLKSNRELADPIRRIQRLQDQPGRARADLSWEQALQAFVDRRAPLLVTSSDMLPYLTSRARFPWKAEPLPIAGSASKTSTLRDGADLVLTRDRPGARKFLEFLLSESASAQWARPGGWLPPRADWLKSKGWRENPPAGAAALPDLGSAPPASRSTDAEVVRARSEWVQALRHLFGEKSQRPELEEILAQIDARLAVRPR